MRTTLSYIRYLYKGFKLKSNTIPKNFGEQKLIILTQYGTNEDLYNNASIGDIIYTLPSGMFEYHFFTLQYFIKYVIKCLKQKTNTLYCKEMLINDKYIFIRRDPWSYKDTWVAKPTIKTIPLNGNKSLPINKYFKTKEEYYNYIKHIANRNIQTLQRDKSTNHKENIKLIKSFIKKFNL